MFFSMMQYEITFFGTQMITKTMSWKNNGRTEKSRIGFGGTKTLVTFLYTSWLWSRDVELIAYEINPFIAGPGQIVVHPLTKKCRSGSVCFGQSLLFFFVDPHSTSV